MTENPERVLRMIEEKAKRVFLPIVGREKGEILELIVRNDQPKSILEIGTLVGYSAILMGKNLKKGKVTCIEISPKFAQIARKNIREAGFEEIIRVIEGDALEAIPKLKEKFDLVFIDAAKEDYLSYLKLLEKNKNLKERSVIVADNVKVFAKEVKDYLEYVRESGNYKSSYHDFGSDGVEVSIKL